MFILHSRINHVTYHSAVADILQWARVPDSRWICAANVHVIMEAWDSPSFQSVVNNADLIAPDGMPLVWMMRLRGLRGQTRVYGPTLMLHLLEAAARENIPVGFYGGAPHVLVALVERMNARFPNLKVSYVMSPPFTEMSALEDERVVAEINNSGTRILFVGLGCPKQELWMAAHRGRVNAVMLGVGAAFDFHAGMKPQAPAWMQKVGLEWLFRLSTEPRRLWKRYLYHNPRFAALAIADLLGLLKRID